MDGRVVLPAAISAPMAEPIPGIIEGDAAKGVVRFAYVSAHNTAVHVRDVRKGWHTARRDTGAGFR
jgi:hypothetical protein